MRLDAALEPDQVSLPVIWGPERRPPLPPEEREFLEVLFREVGQERER